jgi:hypothetical protein
MEYIVSNSKCLQTLQFSLQKKFKQFEVFTNCIQILSNFIKLQYLKIVHSKDFNWRWASAGTAWQAGSPPRKQTAQGGHWCYWYTDILEHCYTASFPTRKVGVWVGVAERKTPIEFLATSVFWQFTTVYPESVVKNTSFKWNTEPCHCPV